MRSISDMNLLSLADVKYQWENHSMSQLEYQLVLQDVCPIMVTIDCDVSDNKSLNCFRKDSLQSVFIVTFFDFYNKRKIG
ncbi:hypothetical protein X975_27172, partial [Stegodyphus mimosarum]